MVAGDGKVVYPHRIIRQAADVAVACARLISCRTDCSNFK